MVENAPAHETRDADPGLILRVMALVVIIVLAGSGLMWLGWLSMGAPKDDPVGDDRFATEPPRLQTQPAKELTVQQARWQYQLENAGWVNRKQNLVHMPIERAISLMVQQHGNTEEAGETTP